MNSHPALHTPTNAWSPSRRCPVCARRVRRPSTVASLSTSGRRAGEGGAGRPSARSFGRERCGRSRARSRRRRRSSATRHRGAGRALRVMPRPQPGRGRRAGPGRRDQSAGPDPSRARGAGRAHRGGGPRSSATRRTPTPRRGRSVPGASAGCGSPPSGARRVRAAGRARRCSAPNSTNASSADPSNQVTCREARPSRRATATRCWPSTTVRLSRRTTIGGQAGASSASISTCPASRPSTAQRGPDVDRVEQQLGVARDHRPTGSGRIVTSGIGVPPSTRNSNRGLIVNTVE